MAPSRTARSVERLCDRHCTVVQRSRRIPQIQAQRREHLIIARAAGMQTAAGRADALGQTILDRGLAILLVERDAPLALRMFLADGRERVVDRPMIRRRQKVPARASMSACAEEARCRSAPGDCRAGNPRRPCRRARARRAESPCPTSRVIRSQPSVPPGRAPSGRRPPGSRCPRW